MRDKEKDSRWRWENEGGILMRDVKRCMKMEEREGEEVSKREQKEYVIPVGMEACEKEIVWEYKKYIWEGKIV